ncbi:transmembrane amino acid transporter protein-domain-containing protein [Cokeromyces recurvatus]|uniref:transmembrane amino acid transporter protein-domain-containing protein n=1 Tax=Cokeromyces recurvatus TaxID=90255 RepID=UPI002220F2BA|nr:transmembrane amino acid transporter protein-domain-containing protein [Cokeromyces recurvatus]KAI7900251.1 transmembrane amino acid transporter protein-domain-containing protein [Cokeromyces recurvatus]
MAAAGYQRLDIEPKENIQLSELVNDDRRPLLNTTTSQATLSSSGSITQLTKQCTLYTEDYDEQHATATSMSCIINLSNTILGTGMLAMPSAMASVGLLPGIFLILFSALASGTGLYFLSQCAARTEGQRHSSFFAVSKLTWPKIGVLFDFAIAIKCFGVAVSYLIIIGDLMPQVITPFYTHEDGAYFLTDRRFWITVYMLTLVLPLSFLRKLDSLKYTSLIALVAVIYLCVIVIYHYFSPIFSPLPKDSIDLISINTKILGQLPLFVFAFTCHQNIFTVYNELKDNSKKGISKVIIMSIGSSAFIYEAIAIIGYLSFGKNVRGNIIMEYPSSYFVAGGQFAIVMLVVFGYPLQAYPCRESLDKVISWCSSNLSSKENHRTTAYSSAFKYFAMTTTILICSYIVAICVTQLDLVLSFVGSTGSTTISFILPGLFYYKIHENDPWKPGKIISVFLALYGIFVMTVCLLFNVTRLRVSNNIV